MFGRIGTFISTFILCLALMNLFVVARAIPIVLPPDEGLVLFEDVVAREHIGSNVAKRGTLFTESPRMSSVDNVAKRELPEPPPDQDTDVEARICRYGCL